MSYAIRTERLGLRNWNDSDLRPMSMLNQDDVVMKYFPSKYSEQQTGNFIKRMQDHFELHGFCYFAVDCIEGVDAFPDPTASPVYEQRSLESLPFNRQNAPQFIGFIGLMNQVYESHFTPCVDIGWRLDRSVWGRGYATEGALACLRFAFEHLGLSDVKSVAPAVNTASERVMQKIGMTKVGTFDHPLLLDVPGLNPCNLYQARPSD